MEISIAGFLFYHMNFADHFSILSHGITYRYETLSLFFEKFYILIHSQILPISLSYIVI